MKIIFVGRFNKTDLFTGPEKVAKRLFANLQNENIFFVDYFSDGAKYSLFQKVFGKEIIANKVFRFGFIPFLLFIIKFKPDIIHFVTFERFALVSFLLKPFLKCKYFYHVHGIVKLENKYFKKSIPLFYKLKNRIAEFLFYKFSNEIIFVSEKVKNIAKQNYNFNKFRILHNGVDEVSFKNKIRNKKLKILFTAEPNRPEKGFEFAVEIANELKNKFEMYIFSNDKIKYFKAVKKMEVNKYYKFLSQIDIVISTSIYEPFQLNVIEAMSFGAIPIVTNNIGASEIIKNNFNGFILNFGDKKGFVECVTDLSKNKNLLNKISSISQKRVEKLNWKNISSELLSFYK